MPRYFFNIYDGADMFDAEGTVLPGIREMRLYMLTAATEILNDPSFRADTWQMEALDESGKIVGTMDFGLKNDASDD